VVSKLGSAREPGCLYISVTAGVVEDEHGAIEHASDGGVEA
jgi:hypothetical protein